MRLSEMAGKEMVDVCTGTRIGALGGADLVFDEETGKIDSILLSAGGFTFGKKRVDSVIPWGAIVKIGPDMIILDSEAAGMSAPQQTAPQQTAAGSRAGTRD